MSVFIRENDKFYDLFDYVLSESIKPKKISYGTNDKADNLNMGYDKVYYTFFKQFSHNLVVFIGNNGIMSFGVIPSDTNLIDNMFNANVNRLNQGLAAKSFSYVFYIVLKMVNVYNINIIKFSGADNGLDKFYDKLVTNKFFIDHLSKEGWLYKGKEDKEKHIFIKK